MRYIQLTILLCFFAAVSYAQNDPPDLSRVRTKEEAEKFIRTNPGADGKLFHIDSRTEAAVIFSPLFDKQEGYSFRIDNYTYKIIAFDSALAFRVSYIYLDGSKMKKEEIYKLRKLIISKYKSGTSFADLASQYGMDGNTTGDTNWFMENEMAIEFETAVAEHKQCDIFTVDIPRLNWYHVVLKTFDDTYKKNITLLRVKNGN